MEDELNKLVLGALLHDIGKFKQRADFPEDAGKTHVEIGHSWLVSQYDEVLIAAGARNHHGNEPETWETNFGLIFFEADNCSASERCDFDPQTDIGKAWHRQMRLGNVFARVCDPACDPIDWSRSPNGSYWSLQPLGGWLEPDQDERRENSAEDYRRMWQAFEQEFQAVRSVGNHLSVDVMLHLLEKYTAFIPSITLKIKANTEQETYRKHPDVSLFDHLKLAAAVAACLYHYHSTTHRNRWERREPLKEEIADRKTWDDPLHQPFLLVGGDLSGVQRFIYTISSKGALKSLKGRSFFLELLTEHVVDRLLEELALMRCNVIFTGGGHFYLIGPNTEQVRQAISAVRTEINDYLLEAFGGTLWQAVESIPFGKAAFKDPLSVWGLLSAELEQAKRKKWQEQLSALVHAPAEPHTDCYTTNCGVCGREDVPLEDEIGDSKACRWCWEQFKLGANLRRAVTWGERPVIYRWDEAPPEEHRDKSIRIGARYYQPSPNVFGRDSADVVARASAVFHLNEWDLTWFTHPSSRPLMVGMYQLGGGASEDPPDLEELVAGGFGMDRLGVLRMDVDRLGKIFTMAVPESERTFSRMASLSRHLSLFFKYHLNQVLNVGTGHGYEKLKRTNVAGRGNGSCPPPRRLAVVYSGGDDLFLIGHWLDVTEAAFDIREAFQRFTGNPYITISAGIALGYPHEPVYRLAEVAGEAERKAKAKDADIGKPERNSVTLFGNRTMTWTKAEEVVRVVVEGYVPLLEPVGSYLAVPSWSVSRGFLYRVLLLARDYVGLGATKEKKSVLVLPKVAYLLGRNEPRIREPFQQAAWQLIRDRLHVSPTDENKASYRQLEVATMWTLMLMRKGGRQ